uniref:Pyruvate kinase n=1 Tax=Dictyopteris undulata TaxID=156997 RepID=A0A097IU39_9PHAE|nr:pyruvate kinase [Dictyopteris undulata]
MQRIIYQASSRVTTIVRQAKAPTSYLTILSKGLAAPKDATLVPVRGRPLPNARRSVYTWNSSPPLTKIVATIGPVSEDFPTLQKVVDAGMRVMRVNFSHATFEEAELRLTNLRACKGKHAKALGCNHNLRAVLLDTQGPEIRTGNLKDGGKVELKKGATIELTTNPSYRDEGTAERLFVNYPKLTCTVNVGSAILLDDGLVSIRVTDVQDDTVTGLVENSGELKSRRGVNLPGAKVDLPALSKKDKIDITFGIERDVDFVAASFVRKGEDVRSIRHFIAEAHDNIWPAEHPKPRIISKIENMEAVDNFKEILHLSDGIMVARGDLGVELPAEQITNLQKMMVRECNYVGKPVIVATQMLESMQHNPRPTRAEVSDVTNAVFDGADAVMLSGESAQGKYPVESVYMMRRIIDEAEKWKTTNPDLALPHNVVTNTSHPEGIASAAVHAADFLKAKLIVVVMKEGDADLARLVVKFRPNIPVVCACPTEKLGRQLILHRGLHPLVMDSDNSPGLQPEDAVRAAASVGFCGPRDTAVAVYFDHEKASGQQLGLRVVRVEE